MKHSARKFWAAVLALCMILSLMPMSVLAAEGDSHTVTLSLTNITSSTASSVTVTEGASGASFDATLSADMFYRLPDSITVGGAALAGVTVNPASGNYYNKTSGAVHVEGITADTVIAAAAAAVTPAVRTTELDFADANYRNYVNTNGQSVKIDPANNITDSAEGWAWFANETTVGGTTYAAKTLVLNGVTVETTSDNTGLCVPAGTTVVLADGSTNTIHVTNAYGYGVYVAGNASFVGNGTLNISVSATGAASGSWNRGIICYNAADLTFGTGSDDPKVNITMDNAAAPVKAIDAHYGIELGTGSSVTVNSGDIDIKTLGAVSNRAYSILAGSYTQTGGNVTLTNSSANYCGALNLTDATADTGVFSLSGNSSNLTMTDYSGENCTMISARTFTVSDQAVVSVSGGAVASTNGFTASRISNAQSGTTKITAATTSSYLRHIDAASPMVFGYRPDPAPAFTVKMVETGTSYVYGAGASVTYNVVLTQTAESAFGDTNDAEVQYFDFGIGYDSNLVYTNYSTDNGNIEFNNDSTNHKVTLYMQNASGKFYVGKYNSVKLGTVTFTLPNAEYIKANGWNGTYRVDDFTETTGAKSDDNMICVGAEQSGVQPTITQNIHAVAGQTVGVVVRDTSLTFPATFEHYTVTDAASTSASGNTIAAGTTVSGNSVNTITLTPVKGYFISTVKTNGQNASEKFSSYRPNGYGSWLDTGADASISASDWNNTTGVRTYKVPVQNANSTLVVTTGKTGYHVTYAMNDSDGATKATAINAAYFDVETTSIAIPTPVRAGYTFNGWTVTKTTESGTGFGAANSTMQPGTYTLSGCTGDVTLTAQWTANEQSAPTDGGEKDKGNVSQTSPAGTPKTDETVTITVTPATGKMLASITASYMKDGTTKTDVALTGDANNSESGTGTLKYTYVQPAGQVTVTPVYADISYIVTYDAAGGTAVSNGSYTISTGSFTLPAAPTREGYTFAGWKVTSDTGATASTAENPVYFKSGNTYTESQTVTLTSAYGPATITAQWTADTQTVTTSANPEVSLSSDTIKTGDTVTVTIVVPAGKQLNGVNIKKTADNTDVTSSASVKQTSSGTTGTQTYTYVQPGYGVTIEPNYSNISYTVTYDNNGATTPGSGGQTSYDVTATSLALPTVYPAKDHYIFAGWKVTTREGGGSGLAKNTILAADAATATLDKAFGNITLTAQWTPVTYTVTLNNNGATTAGTANIYESYGVGYYLDSALANQMSASVNGITVPQKTGYAFAGYYTADNGTGTQYIDKDGKLTTGASASNFGDSSGVLYACWTANVYTVTLNDNDGAGGSGTIYEKYGVGWYSDSDCTAPITKVAIPTKSGYGFNGYYSGETKMISADGTISAANNAFSAAAALTASWSAGTYTATFDRNYTGAPTAEPASETYDAAFVMPATATPTRTGYTFAGWYDSASGGSKVIDANGTSVNTVTGITDASGHYIKADNVTFFAHWTANPYTVTLNKNGGEGANGSVTMTYDSAVFTKPATPVKSNYAFAGWTVTQDGTDYVIDASGNAVKGSTYFDTNGNWIYANDLTLYAKWSGNTYTLTLDAQSGSGSPSSIKEIYGTGYTDASGTAITSVTVPTRTRYTFGGFYTAVNGGGTQVIGADGTIITNSTAFTAGATLYAKWTGLSYTITLNDYGGSGGSGSIYERYGDGFYKTNTDGTLSNKITTADNAVAVPTFAGYTFGGYYTYPKGDGIQYIDANGYLTANASATNFSAADTLYAKWTANVYTVTLDPGAVYTSAGTGVIYEKYGVGWYSDAACTNKITSITIPAREGYTFVSYCTADAYKGRSNAYSYVDSDGTLDLYADFVSDITLHAAWMANQYKVTFNANCAGIESPTYGYDYDAKFESYSPSYRAGYTFAGWYTEAKGGTMVADASCTTQKSVAGIIDANGNYVHADALTLYAHWQGNEQTNTLPATAAQKSINNVADTTSKPRTGDTVVITVTPPDGQRIATLAIKDGSGSGVEFTPTTFNADGSAQDLTFTQPASGVTVTPTFEYITYTVTYDDNNATVNHSGGGTTFTYNSKSIALPTAPTRTGYTFGGWTITRTGSVGKVNGGSNDVEAEATSIVLESAAGNITLTAKWAAQPHSATFSVADVNTSVNDSATIAYGDGFTTEHQVLTGTPASFTVDLKTGYAVKSVTYATSKDGTKIPLTLTDGKYTLPANITGTDYWVYIETSLDSSKVRGYAVIDNGTSWQAYSKYSGSKTLVLLNVDASITGLTTNTGAVLYKTNAYAGYNYAVLLDLAGNNINATQEALEAYLLSILQVSNTENSSITYNKDVNGLRGFQFDDVSVEYDFTSRSMLNWVPTDAYLMIGDIAGNGTSTPDMTINEYDVAAFVAAHNAPNP